MEWGAFLGMDVPWLSKPSYSTPNVTSMRESANREGAVPDTVPTQGQVVLYLLDGGDVLGEKGKGERLAVYRQPTGSLDQIPSTTWPRGPPPLHRRTLPRSRRGNIPNIIKPARSFLPLSSHWPLGPLCWRPLPTRQLSRLGNPILPSSESNKEPCLRRRARPSNHQLP